MGGFGAALLGASRLAFAAGAATDRQFVFIIQRGAADRLAILAPTRDPAYAGLRGDLAADAARGTRVDAVFALHPALAQNPGLYAAKQALFVHVVASPYRSRSHFDGQNALERRSAGAYRIEDGWMNRLLDELGRGKCVALAPTVPLALRGACRWQAMRRPTCHKQPTTCCFGSATFKRRMPSLGRSGTRRWRRAPRPAMSRPKRAAR